MASRYITRIKASDIKSSLPDLFKILSIVSIVQIQQTVCKYKARICIVRIKLNNHCATRNKVWPPPSFIKLPEALIIFPEFRNPDKQTQNRDFDNTELVRKTGSSGLLEKPVNSIYFTLPGTITLSHLAVKSEASCEQG